MIGRFGFIIVVQRVIQLALAQSAGRWTSERGGMGTGEGVDHFGQRAEVKMKQTADRVMVIEPVTLGGEPSEAGGALESARCSGLNAQRLLL